MWVISETFFPAAGAVLRECCNDVVTCRQLISYLPPLPLQTSIRSSYFDSQRKKAYRYLQAGLLRKSYCAGANVGVGDCHLREIKYHRRYRDDLEEFGVAVSKERR